MTLDHSHDVRTLRALLDDVRAAAAELADPVRGVISRDDGTRTLHTAASLLDQLAAEAEHGTTRRGAGRGSSGAPVAIDVVDLHTRIRAESAAWFQWFATNPARIPADLRQRVRTIACGAGQLTDLDDLVPVHRALGDWCRSIRAVLDPPRRMHLTEPCPACEVATVHQVDGTGEQVRHPALWVDAVTGCTCVACGAQWEPDRLPHLAEVLGCRPLTA